MNMRGYEHVSRLLRKQKEIKTFCRKQWRDRKIVAQKGYMEIPECE